MELSFKYRPFMKYGLTFLLFTIASFAFFGRRVLKGPQPRICNKKAPPLHENLLNLAFEETYESEISYRNEITEKICRTYPEFLPTKKNFHSLFWQNSSHLVFCYHPKAGSSTLLKVLLRLVKEKYLSEGQAEHLAEDLLVREDKDQDFKDSILVNLIQDPFSRLIDGYREKMRDPGSRSLKEKIMKLRTYVKESERWRKLLYDESFELETEPTPEEYLVYVVTQIEICEAKDAPEGCWGLLPSLWKPYHMDCSPCAFKYDIISKIETFDNDLKYMKHKVKKIIEKEKANPSANKDELDFMLNTLSDPQDEQDRFSRNATNEYAIQVSRLLNEYDKQRFRRAYRFDYLLFDYNPFEFE